MKIVVFCAACLWAGAATAADRPLYGPPPAWVTPLPIPKIPIAVEGAAIQVLLQDSQARFTPDQDEFYVETAIRVVSSQGLAAGNVILPWKPSTETITVHKLRILRGDQTIDLLAGGKTLTVIRRETNLELAMLDGALTATLQPEDVRVRDILNLAFTLARRDPVLKGLSEARAKIPDAGVIGRVHFRASWPQAKAMRWQAAEGLGRPLVTKGSGQTQILVDMANVEAPKAPAGAPPRFDHLGELELSQFANWAEVSALMSPLYAKAAALPRDSALRAEVAKIRAAAGDPQARTAAALRLVQQQVRYLYLGMNNSGWVPADAEVTWKRRFGDCKAKTALLLALLAALGIEAEPALVSTNGDGLDERLPMPELFDHVIVRARIGGETYWLDGTRVGDRNLDDIPPPAFRWALPVRPFGATLERIDQPPLSAPRVETVVKLDATAGLGAPAPAHVEEILRGDESIATHLLMDNLSNTDRQRHLTEFWTGLYPWITANRVEAIYDQVRGDMRLSMDGAANLDWARFGTARQFDIGESGLGSEKSFKRQPGPHRDAPFAVDYPTFSKRTVAITLPRKGATFVLGGGRDVDATIAGVAYQRRSRIQNGVATMVASERSVAPEFPASQADAAATALRDLSRLDVVIQAENAPEETVEHPEDMPAPADAAGFSRRGVSFLVERSYDRAIADFTSAARLEPTVAKHVYNRGVAHFENGQDTLALADFDRALGLDPKDELAASARGRVYLEQGAEAAARKDFDRAIATSSDPAKALWRAAGAYRDAGRFDGAVRYYDQLIGRYPTHHDRAQMLSDRCGARALWGRQLESGLADCDAALASRPSDALALEGRALVELRLGRLDKAIADYDAVIAVQPDLPSAFYGRGVARLRKGLKVEGAADIAEAARIDPAIAPGLAKYGVKP